MISVQNRKTNVRPKFPKLGQPWRKLFLTLHVGFSVAWLGMAGAMTVLSSIGFGSEDPALRHYAYAFMHIFDLALVIPLVLLSILTGLVLALGTPWGLTQYWWILTKLILSLAIVIFAAVKENFWVRGLAETTAETPGAEMGNLPLLLMITMIVFGIMLWVATVLSIYKPWGRTPWGEQQWMNKRVVKAKAFNQVDRTA